MRTAGECGLAELGARDPKRSARWVLTDSADHGQKNSPRQSLPRHVDSLSSLSVAETVGRFPRGSENWRWPLGRTRGEPLVGLGPAGPSRELKFTLRPLRARGTFAACSSFATSGRGGTSKRKSFEKLSLERLAVCKQLPRALAVRSADRPAAYSPPSARCPPGGSQRSGGGAGGGWAALPPLAAHWAAHVWVSVAALTS